jgi:predicted membrane-bound spermidine synthase
MKDRSQFIRAGGRDDDVVIFNPVDAQTDAEAKRRAREFRAALRRELDNRGLLRRPANRS